MISQTALKLHAEHVNMTSIVDEKIMRLHDMDNFYEWNKANFKFSEHFVIECYKSYFSKW